jgi:glycosyltransferase involved in cell wall biosynthesis
MRIVIANDGISDAGGVQTYLSAVTGGLVARGHTLAILHCDSGREPPDVPAPIRTLPRYNVTAEGLEGAVDRLAGWAPDLCFSHNMNLLGVDRALLARWPVVKFMHGYFGTCIGGEKRHGFPVAQPCSRRFGIACLALYGPRRCGSLKPASFVRDYRWAREQHALLPRYRAVVVASEHMKREFVQNGVDHRQIHVNPLFGTSGTVDGAPGAAPADAEWSVAFVGRMTTLKGGELLIDAIAHASARLGRTIRLLMIGDGPRRVEWEQRAAARQVPCTSTGWLAGDARWAALQGATLLAVPSTWPEPFGLVGLEAGGLGIPAVAFDLGGVREWLRPGINGYLAPGDPPRASGLGDAIVEALSDTNRLHAMGARAIDVAKEMSVTRHLDRLDAIFSTVPRWDAHPAGR